MSLITSIANTFHDLFVPHDGLYRQAKDAISQADGDADGRVSLASLTDRARTPPNGSFGITDLGYVAADNLGDKDGYASVKEVRHYLKLYDEDTNRQVEGVELLTLLDDLEATRPTSAAAQARAGVRQRA